MRAGSLVRVYKTTDTSTTPQNAIYGQMTSTAAAFSTSSVTLPAVPDVVVQMFGNMNVPAGAVFAFPGLDVVANKVFFSLSTVPYIQGTSAPVEAETYLADLRYCSKINCTERLRVVISFSK